MEWSSGQQVFRGRVDVVGSRGKGNRRENYRESHEAFGVQQVLAISQIAYDVAESTAHESGRTVHQRGLQTNDNPPPPPFSLPASSQLAAACSSSGRGSSHIIGTAVIFRLSSIEITAVENKDQQEH